MEREKIAISKHLERKLNIENWIWLVVIYSQKVGAYMTNITYVQHMAIQDQIKRQEEVKKNYDYMCSKCDKADCKKEYEKQFDCYYNH